MQGAAVTVVLPCTLPAGPCGLRRHDRRRWRRPVLQLHCCGWPPPWTPASTSTMLVTLQLHLWAALQEELQLEQLVHRAPGCAAHSTLCAQP